MTAFYNELDPFAAQWLRNLIAAGHIAPGIVDERDIRDIKPSELRSFTQCHFFAGIGVWSYGLRLAGWSDDRPIWTGSCPCQPFSASGKRGGFDDERHLWPSWQHLIHECGPSEIVGEQVASKDGYAWLDLVQSDLEGMGYACGAVVSPSAGYGAPHERHRQFFGAKRLAFGEGQRSGTGFRDSGPSWGGIPVIGDDGTVRVVGVTHDARLEGLGQRHQAPIGRNGTVRSASATGELSGLADDWSSGRDTRFTRDAGTTEGARGECRNVVDRCGTHGDMADAGGGQLSQPIGRPQERNGSATVDAGHQGTGPTNGFWRDADWLFCRDERWRAVEPGTFPLAHGASARVGRLRGYGNAINAYQAKAFIEAFAETIGA